MTDLDYDELARMIDLKIAASLERIADKDINIWVIVKEEIEWLRMP